MDEAPPLRYIRHDAGTGRMNYLTLPIGNLIRARPVGVLQMLDEGVPDEKVLAVAASDPARKVIRDHKDFAPHVLREIEHFFSVYKELQGKHTHVRGWRDAHGAFDLIRSAHGAIFRACSKARIVTRARFLPY